VEELLRHQYWMKKAIAIAKKAGERGEIPVGAIIIDENNHLLATASNQKEAHQDATAHAEILAIRQASDKLGTWRLNRCSLYVTLEPCPMCAGAIVQARIKTLIYGVDDFKTGAIRTVVNIPDSLASYHHLQVFAGIKQSSCLNLLQSWFKNNRSEKQ
jgi:tRNA(adenine34) deaminase